MLTLSQQWLSPLARFTQPPPHSAAQLTQTPAALQLGVALLLQVPHCSVPPQPSGAVPQLRPNSAHVLGMQTHFPL